MSVGAPPTRRSARVRSAPGAQPPRPHRRPRPAPHVQPRVRSGPDPDLHVPKAGGSGAVRDVCTLTGLTLPAVRHPVQAPRVASRNGVEGAPELWCDSGVRCIAQHAPELAALDLPGDLCAELE